MEMKVRPSPSLGNIVASGVKVMSCMALLSTDFTSQMALTEFSLWVWEMLALVLAVAL